MDSESEKSNTLERRIVDRIRENGPITFAEFMEAALYDPEDGYYTCGRNRIGFEGGDYFTSPAMSPAFGATLARLVPIVDDALHQPEKLCVIELGAGAGLTARQILDTLKRNQRDLYERIEYYCVERSPSARDAGQGSYSLLNCFRADSQYLNCARYCG